MLGTIMINTTFQLIDYHIIIVLASNWSLRDNNLIFYEQSVTHHPQNRA